MHRQLDKRMVSLDDGGDDDDCDGDAYATMPEIDHDHHGLEGPNF